MGLMDSCYFHSERWAALIDVVGREAKAGDAEAAETLDYIGGHLQNFLAYVRVVGISEIGIRIAAASMEGEALRDQVAGLDRERSRNHDAAIASAASINRIAAAYGVGPVYTGDPALRRQVAAFCLEFTTWLFEHRR